MMRDANTHHSDDPARRWSSLLDGLFGDRRETVIKALRNSAASGYPADADGVRILVSYAQGQISARQYVTQVLESLGFAPAAYTPAPAHQPYPWTDAPSAPRARQAATPDLLDWSESWHQQAPEPERFGGNTITQSRHTRRQRAVQAYVNGQIPVEEFLRLTHGSGG